MKKNKMIATLLVGVMSVGILSGCGNTDNPSDKTTEEQYNSITVAQPITESSGEPGVTENPSISGPAKPISELDTSQYNGIFGTMQTGYDQASGVEVVEAFVPYGWTMETAVNWNTADMSYPGQATVVIQSPDGQATIIYQTASHYEQSMDSMGNVDQPKIDTTLRIKIQPYMTADEYISYFYDNNFSTDHTWICDLEKPQALTDYVNGNLETMISSWQEQLDLVNSVPGNTMGNSWSLVGAEATVGYRQDYLNFEGVKYRTEAMAVNYGCEIEWVAAPASITVDLWDNDFVIMYAAASDEAFDAYHDYFKMIYENLALMPRFVYLVKAYSQQLWAIRLDAQNTSNKEFNDMLNDYSGGTAADRFTESWCDVITERDSYQTLDGDLIKTPHDGGSVYQNNDEYYYGDPGEAPPGWTQLNQL